MQRKAFIEQFEWIADQRADCPAMIADGRSIHYRALNGWANRIAHALLGAGQGGAAGAPVGLFLEPGIDYAAGLLGIAKTAGAFLPMPVDLPQQRLLTFLDTARTTLVLTDAAHEAPLRDRLAQLERAERVTVAVLEAFGATAPEHNPGVPITPVGGAYVMFTSGSTGVPKAILGQQRGLSHFLRWELETFGIDAACRGSWLAPINFDVSLRDLLVPLMAGGVVCVPHPDTRLTPHLLVDWLAAQQVTLVHCVPTVLRLIIRHLEDRADSGVGRAEPFPALRHLLVAGEPLYGTDVAAWRTVAGSTIAMANLYGPSETTLAKLFYPLTEVPDDPRRMIPIGRPLPQTEVLVVAGGRACGVGEIGEIYLRTPYRSLGYLNDPVATAAVFVANPLTGDSADILYRTGDLGRLSEDGILECLGRKDGQFKINGVRMDVSEIEAALRQLPLFREVAVTAEPGPDRQPMVVAYVTRRDGSQGTLDDETIAAALDPFLPRAMQPRHYAVLAALPKTVTGKLNRRALPSLEVLLQDEADYVAPAGDLETQIAAIWRQVLGVPRVGATRRFPAYGGDSLKAIKVVAEIYRSFQVDVPLREFFGAPTVRGLAAHVASLLAQPVGREDARPLPTAPVPQTLPRAGDAPDYPATPAQSRLWSLYRMGVAPSAYNLAEAFLIAGVLDGVALAAALALIVERHEALRTTFVEREGKVRQVIHKTLPVILERGDLRAAREPTAAAAELFAANRDHPFDLERGPLFQAGLHRLPDDTDGQPCHLLLFNIHHIVSDVQSLAILVEELGQAYDAFRQGSSPALAPVALRYRDFAVWQEQRLVAGALASQRDYWLRVFATVPPPLGLPTDRPRPPVQSFVGDTRRVVLDAALLQGLERVARDAGTTRFALLISLVMVHLHRLTGHCDLTVGTPVLGRDRPEFERVVGYCVNTVGIRAAVATQEPFSALLGRVATAVQGAMENQSFPFDALVNALPLERDMSRSPLFDVMVVEQALEGLEFDLPGVRTTVFGREEDAWKFSRFDLVFHFQTVVGGLALDINFNTDLFDAARIERYGRQFATLTAAVTEHPACPLGQLALLPAAERNTISAFATGPRVVRPAGATISGLVTQVAARQPDRPALIDSRRCLTYAQMMRAADRLAARLIATGPDGAGIVEGDRVAVYASRSVESVIALLGIMKAGAIYVPIDSEYPPHRVATLIAQVGSRLVLVDHEDQAGELPSGLPPVLAVSQVLTDQADPAPIDRAQAGEVAYIIFTSGSTGEPKAVLAEHSGFINMSLGVIEAFGLTAADRILQFASPSFDASLFNIANALFAGGTLILPERSVIDSLPRFLAFLEQTATTYITLPPTYLRLLKLAPLPSLRVLLTAGEAAPVADLLHYATTLRAFNGYGPTEASVCTSVHQVTAADEGRVRLPIGRPLPNTTLYILDPALNPVPIGVSGEIYLGGAAVTRGYQGNPEQTAKQFLLHPQSGERLYRTGDMACWLSDGTVDFLGRTDHQVKISGHRIELAEVEHALRGLDGVRDVHVTTLTHGDGSLALVGYFVADIRLESSAIRRQLHRLLPGYEVPAYLVALDALPMTVSGKVNRAALPAPELSSVAGSRPAETAVEEAILTIWRVALERADLGVDDDFFALGGDSIRAIQIVSALRAQGLMAEVRDIFTNPTVRDLATVIGGGGPSAVAPPAAAPLTGPAPVTPIQRWFFSEVTQDHHHFNQAVELCWAGALSVDGAAQAVTALWQHHDQLRSTFPERDGRRIQWLADDLGAPTLIRLAPAASQEAYRAAAAVLHTGFDLRQGPLFGAVILADGAAGGRVLLVAHHLVVDAVSWLILIEDFARAYDAALAGRPLVLPAKTTAYLEIARAIAPGSDAPVPVSPPIPPTPGLAPVTVEGRLDAVSLAMLMETVAPERGVPLEALLLGALARAWEQTGLGESRPLVAEVERHGRDRVPTPFDVSRTVGWFTVVVPLTLDARESAYVAAQTAAHHLRDALPIRTPRVAADLVFNHLGTLVAKPDGAFTVNWDVPGPVMSPAITLGSGLEILTAIEDGALTISVTARAHDLAVPMLEAFRSALEEMVAQGGIEATGRYDLSPEDLDLLLNTD